MSGPFLGEMEISLPSTTPAPTLAPAEAGACEVAPNSPRACVNCLAPLPQPVPPFCPQCGQETHIRAPKLWEFLQQFGGHYLATEGALWRSMQALLFRPGFLSTEYLRGRRKHYVLPLRLYITISLLLLLVLRFSWEAEAPGEVQRLASAKPVSAAPAGAAESASTASAGAQVRPAGPASRPGSQAAAGVTAGVGGAKDEGAPQQGAVNIGPWQPVKITAQGITCDGLPERMCQRLKHRFSSDLGHNPYELEQFVKRALSLSSSAMFVLLPLFAFWLWLLFGRSGLHYTEHLVVALHLHAFWFVVFTLLALGGWVLEAGMASALVFMLWRAWPQSNWREWAQPWLHWGWAALGRWLLLALGLSLMGHGSVVLAAFVALPVYSHLALRRVYGQSHWGTLWRLSTLGFINLNVVLLTVGLVMMLAAVI
jgi:hypothetical protein